MIEAMAAMTANCARRIERGQAEDEIQCSNDRTQGRQQSDFVENRPLRIDTIGIPGNARQI